MKHCARWAGWALRPRPSLKPRRFFVTDQDDKGESLVEITVNNLLYNTRKQAPKSRHILSCLLANEPGVLSRVSGILASRGINIDSLVVGTTEVPLLSRATIVLCGADVDQAKKQLEDLVQVWAVVDYSPSDPVIERELCLVKLQVPTDTGNAASRTPITSPFTHTNTKSSLDQMTAYMKRQSLVDLTKLFGGRVVDVATHHVTVELTAKAARIDAFLQLVKPYGIVECSRSGPMAMLRGSLTGFEESVPDKKAQKETVDESQLPPG